MQDRICLIPIEEQHTETKSLLQPLYITEYLRNHTVLHDKITCYASCGVVTLIHSDMYTITKYFN